MTWPPGARPLLAAQVVDAYAAYVELVAARLDRQVRNDLESLDAGHLSLSSRPPSEGLFLELQTAATRRTFLGSPSGIPPSCAPWAGWRLAARARVEEMAWAR